MKTFNKKQLNEKAQPVFKRYPKAKEVFATEDGQFFLAKNRAELHAKDAKLSVFEIQKEGQSSENKNESENVLGSIADLKKTIAKMDSVEGLKEVLLTESQGEDRKGAKKAIEARIEELTKQD